MMCADADPHGWAEIMSLEDAAAVAGVSSAALRKAIARGRLVPGRDCRKYGKQWIVSLQGLLNYYHDYGYGGRQAEIRRRWADVQAQVQAQADVPIPGQDRLW